MNPQDAFMKSAITILRMFDEEKAKEFYVEFLEFTIDWEHRFEAGMPLYMQISNGDCIIHLSEHHGDSSPGVAIRIEVGDIKELQSKLLAKNYKYARPGLENTPWNALELSIDDPFKNRIVFYQSMDKKE
ncbi:glyoxalase superfamily protein [Bacillus sp. FSL K6-3431]|uniref:glyoxalase superfamily protein n=1 Tax=Bacillus sp. FSL K6-3431 TaxID=2921500 RepID=UPI0030F5B892